MAHGATGEEIETTVTDIQSTILLERRLASDYDGLRRPQRVTFLDNTFEEVAYGCCEIDSTLDRTGVRTFYAYDVFGRRAAETRLAITLTNVLNPAGDVLETWRLGTNGSAVLLKSSDYNTTGRVLLETNALGSVTQFIEGLVDGRLVRTNIYANGGTRIETFFKDGTLQKAVGTATYPVEYTYGLVPDTQGDPDSLNLFRKEIRLNTDGTQTPETITTFIDFVGREYKTMFAAASPPYPAHQTFFNAKGQPEKYVDPDGVTTRFQYDLRGQTEYVVLDYDRDDVVDFPGGDRILKFERSVVYDALLATHVQKTDTRVWPTDTVDASRIQRTVSITPDGMIGAETIWNGASSLTTKLQRSPLTGTAFTLTLTMPDNTSVVEEYQDSRLIAVTSKDSSTNLVQRTAYTFDPHGRISTAADARNGVTYLGYNNADQIQTIISPPPGTGQPPQTTTFAYSSLGLLTNTVYADQSRVTNLYYLTGDLQRASGSQTFPVEYTYDPQGRVRMMTTWTNFASATGASTTTWEYDPYRGFLTRKLDAANKGPTYAYRPSGKLATRTWQRGVSTTYGYNNAGDLTLVSPSDGPYSAYFRDRLGRVTSVSTPPRTDTFAYNEANLLIRETTFRFGSGTPTLAVTNVYDAHLRPSSTMLVGYPATSQQYTYDAASRLKTVGDGTHAATYTYAPYSPLVSKTDVTVGGVLKATVSKEHDYLDRVQNVTGAAAASNQLPLTFGYRYNDLNQLTKTHTSDGSFWSYDYDTLGQVRNAKRSWSDTTPVPGQQFEYTFDDIGNRRTVREGGDETGGPGALRVFNYTPNPLRQIESRTVPDKIDVLGSAHSAATVSINSDSSAVYRNRDYFRKEVTVANNSYPSINASATLTTNSASTSGRTFIPPATETFTYDDDGNLLSDGRWSYTWDANNQLTQIESLPGAPAGSERRLNFDYDHLGRRIAKRVYTNTTYTLATAVKYIYSGWNLLAELNEADNTLIRSYIWGLDDTGAIDESLGVGGLVAIADAVHGVHFVLSDGQGNVAGLVKATDGTRSATYEYDPFGQTLRKTGSAIADLNPFRYAGRFTDVETDLTYYGFRYYSGDLGRWLSRDPLGEWSGPNLYAFVGNDPANYNDMLGLIDWAALGCIGKGLAKNLFGQVKGVAEMALTSVNPFARMEMAQGLANATLNFDETVEHVKNAVNEAIEQYAASDAGCIDPCIAREMEANSPANC